MRPTRIIGHIVLICFLWVTLCAFLFTVIRHPVFLTFPRRPILYSYGMIAPYQSAVAPHGAIHAECMDSSGMWIEVDLAPFYPQMFGEQNARQYFAMYSYSGTPEADAWQHEHYALALQHLLINQGKDCTRVRLAWDKWPAMTGPFDELHISTFTDRLPLYGYDAP